jgi:accessory gene regulator protein AgrB
MKGSNKVVTIADVADRIGEHIGEQAGLQTEEVKRLCYGVECLLVMLLSIVIILAAGWFCGVFVETAFITLAALFMKHIIGGPHLSGLLRCIGFSALILVGSAWLLRIYGSPSFWWFAILALLGSGVILLYGPLLATEFHFSEKQIGYRKILGVFLLMALTSLNIWHRQPRLTASIIGILVTIMLRTPIGVWIVHWVETITKRKEAQST